MSEFDEQAGRRAWLALLKEDYRRLGADTRYDDDAASHYSWDNRVPNHQQVKVGDIIALWDEHELLGMSVIEAIERGVGTKDISRCRTCGKTNLERRTTLSPEYRCYNCKETFDAPVIETVPVETFRSNHSQGWISLPGTLRADELRALCVKPKSQNSFRELRWSDFLTAMRLSSDFGNLLAPLEVTAMQLNGGHTIRPVRVRVGQTGFRAELLRRFGAVCAFSGPLPAPALDACHLYSYATVGHHDPHGGLLLRRDLHTLFDRGLIAVDRDCHIDVSFELRPFPIYSELHGRDFAIEPDNKQKKWLRLHWDEFRPRAS
ncbi:HNH endonuclease [Nocardia sp. NPDC052254]|uniref:HNH endonuclease n=1 Tax=Nocardia sp. NPDC052254 TaxID=3155681 RepID=UPI003445FA78